jgi:hypothetical protein
MKTSIEITQRDNDETDYLALITELLNKRFKTKETMEQRWQLNCLDVCQELGGKLEFCLNSVKFDFSEVY